MTHACTHIADKYRHFWRFVADNPDLPESQRRFATRMAKKMEASSDQAVAEHAGYAEKAAKKGKAITYTDLSEVYGYKGVFCSNELGAMGHAIDSSAPNVKKGGRKKGSGTLKSRFVTRKLRERFASKYIELRTLKGYTKESAARWLWNTFEVDGFRVGTNTPTKKQCVGLYECIESFDEFKAIC